MDTKKAATFEVGDKVKSRPNTLAYICYDFNGTVEQIDGPHIMVRMNQSGRLVPFRSDQLEPIAAGESPPRFRCTMCEAESEDDPPDCPRDGVHCNIIEVES